MEIIIPPLKIIILSAILFVWVVRYFNIVEEFKFYQYPDWLRDLVGILKISFAIMINQDSTLLIQIGSAGIAILMLAALSTHIKVKNPLHKALPSTTLMILSSLIFYSTL